MSKFFENVRFGIFSVNREVEDFDWGLVGIIIIINGNNKHVIPTCIAVVFMPWGF